MLHKLFTSTSSTKLEIETLLWALEEVVKRYPLSNIYGNMFIYTDSQCISGLLNRREKLENNNYKNLKKDEVHKNAKLYEKFYEFYDSLFFKIIQLKGHSKSSLKDNLHQIFTLVDKDSRKALKMYRKSNSHEIEK